MKRSVLSLATGLLLGLIVVSGASAALPVGPGTTFVTSYVAGPTGAIPGGDSGYNENSNADRSAFSTDGRFLAFVSDADGLDPAANRDLTNVYRKDRTTGAIELVSRATGATAPGPLLSSTQPRISGDGNLVAFVTPASLTPTDLDEFNDVYVRDLTAKTTSLATPDTITQLYDYDISADGTFIAFRTEDSLVVGDANAGMSDVYRRNLSNGTINLVSRTPAVLETAGNGFSSSPTISGDGRWVSFASHASNLIPGFVDNNAGGSDVFARDMTAGQNYLVSAKFNSASASGNGDSSSPAIAGTPGVAATVKIAYDSSATDVAAGGVDASDQSSIYLRSLSGIPSTLISQSSGGANADSRANQATISDDGNLVFFSSDATNLGAGADYYGAYLRNVSSGTTTLGSAHNDYAIAQDVSGNGGQIAWVEQGGATQDSDPDGTGVFTRSIPGGPVSFASRPPGSDPFLSPGASVSSPDNGRTISADGRFIAFEAYSNRLPDNTGQSLVYRRDLVTGDTELASRSTGAAGTKAVFATDPSISADGSRVGFISSSPLDPVDGNTQGDAYVRDFSAKTTTLASRADGAGGAIANAVSDSGVISGDGKRMIFETGATNLGALGGNFQVYVRNLDTSQTTLVSRATGIAGAAGNNDSEDAHLSNDGQLVVFASRSANLDLADADTDRDIFVRDLAANTTVLVSRQTGLAGAAANGFSRSPAISADGKVIAFRTDDPALATEAGPWPMGTEQIVSRVLATGANALVSRAAGGTAGNDDSRAPSIDADGSVITFHSDSDNLLPGLGGDNRSAVFARQSATAALSGPPTFGLLDNSNGSNSTSISDNGQCMSFVANGSNQVSGIFDDLDSSYVFVVSGTCSDPRLNPPVETPKPALTKVSLSPKKFAVSKKATAAIAAQKKAKKGTKVKFTLNVNASVTIRIDRKVAGRKVKGKCVKVRKANRKKKKCSRFVKAGKLIRKTSKAGPNTVAFSGRIGKKKLRPGKYRASLTAYNATGASKTVRKPFTVVRK